jgi:hypothetical protein
MLTAAQMRARTKGEVEMAKEEHRISVGHTEPHMTEGAHRAHWIDSLNEHESHHGESLATKNHDVIRRWAEERKATPATVPGTERGTRPSVLTFDFPGYGGQDLKHISWDEWFKGFDQRGLMFRFQEHLRDGRQSNFFHLDNPHREEG